MGHYRFSLSVLFNGPFKELFIGICTKPKISNQRIAIRRLSLSIHQWFSNNHYAIWPNTENRFFPYYTSNDWRFGVKQSHVSYYWPFSELLQSLRDYQWE